MTEASKMQFSAEIKEHSSVKIMLQLTFDNPAVISAFGQEIFAVKFKSLSLFKSATSLKEIALDSFEGGQPVFIKAIPPMIVDVKRAA